MTAIDTPITQSIQQVIAIIQQGRALERMLIEAGFIFAEAGPAPAATNKDSLTVQPAPTEGAPDAPEWPRANADGELVDVRGIVWDERIHASSKACIADGSWRMRRGADPALIARYEAEALQVQAPREPDAEPKSIEASEEAEPIRSEFERVKIGIERAANQNEIEEWWAYSNEVVISQSQRYALAAVVEERKRQLAAAERKI